MSAPLAADVTTRFATLVPPTYVPQHLKALGWGESSPCFVGDCHRCGGASTVLGQLFALRQLVSRGSSGGPWGQPPIPCGPRPTSFDCDGRGSWPQQKCHPLARFSLVGRCRRRRGQPGGVSTYRRRFGIYPSRQPCPSYCPSSGTNGGATRKGVRRRLFQVGVDPTPPYIPSQHSGRAPSHLARIGTRWNQGLSPNSRNPTNMDVSLAVPGQPVITTKLAKDVSQLCFMQGMNDLEGCLSPFSTSYPDQASVSKANYYNSFHDQQAMGGMSPMLTELINLKEAQARAIPMLYMELKEVFVAYHRLLQVLLGDSHPVAVGFRNLFNTLERIAMPRLLPTIKNAKACAQYMWFWLGAQG
jgi:hypothetical protein